MSRQKRDYPTLLLLLSESPIAEKFPCVPLFQRGGVVGRKWSFDLFDTSFSSESPCGHFGPTSLFYYCPFSKGELKVSSLSERDAKIKKGGAKASPLHAGFR